MATSLEVLARERCSAILRTGLPEAVAPALAAAVDGGFRVIEVTMTTPNALQHIATWSRHEDILVGAGTVLDVGQAEAAAAAGASFLVSPVCDLDVIRRTVEQGLVAIAGTATPTEMLTAHRAGAQLQKIFPAPAGGPAYARAVLAPMPFLRLFPTAGVTLENAAAWLEAGAFGLGFVGTLFHPNDLAQGRFDAIRIRAQALIAAVRSAKR